jgi:hypothetical protein
MEHLKSLAYSLLGGPAAVTLYTTDGGDASYMSHGTLPGEVYASGDGNDLGVYAAEDQFNPAGWRAHTSSEAYPGWRVCKAEEVSC